MASNIKEIREMLVKFLCSPEHQALLTVKISGELSKAIDHIDRFRSLAEDRMLSVNDPPSEEDKKWLSVFYGNEDIRIPARK
ncbi:MAG: hypothetical protein A4E55_00217 [Pelotomaculum sp. PtaU1.Bin035]|nr:MAG: hypothetical protein A4E55_00217 [Pelotomaculum sp. PtaU1.Bin035]